MEKNLVIAAKALLCFLLMGFALPLLLYRRIGAVWVLSSAGISLAITVVPGYLIARLKRKRMDNHTITTERKWISVTIGVLNRKWVRISSGALFLFIVMIFIIPVLEGMSVDTAWLIISVITAPVAAVLADYLTERQKAKKRQDSRKKKGSKNT